RRATRRVRCGNSQFTTASLANACAVGCGGKGPVGAGQQAAGVLVGVDPGGADPGGCQHDDRGGLYAGDREGSGLGVGSKKMGSPPSSAPTISTCSSCT